jgi:hypothetical protein
MYLLGGSAFLILSGLSLVGFFSSWIWINRDVERDRAEWILSQEAECKKAPDFDRCLEGAYQAIGGEVLVPIFSVIGNLAFILLCVLLFSWYRDRLFKKK